MYKCYYGCWNEKSFSGFKKSLEKLNSDSKNLYDIYKIGRPIEDKKRDYMMIDTACTDLENYVISLVQLKIINNFNINMVVGQLMKITDFNILYKDDKYYGLTTNYQISLNPNIPPIKEFDEEAMKQLVISHELGHIINNMWDNDMKLFVRELFNNTKVRENLRTFGLDEEINLIDGFNLLDEVISEDLAERVTFYRMRKDRPERIVKNDKAIFDHKAYRSNFVLYGEFQDIAIKFCKTLDSIVTDKEASYDDILKKLDILAFNNQLIYNIRNEVMNKEYLIEDFALMLACMGKMKRATYTVIGLAPKKNNVNVTRFVDLFNGLAMYNDNSSSLNKMVSY
jgi:hypothetical protein